ncbi:hypothetical protein WME79_05750 [Sorangium sp. So ce726]|uniref:hypothetical protein n=1 Tax=Sorangium sp. So ce726 TaxID=3133319 RepID=UPI003F5DE534
MSTCFLIVNPAKREYLDPARFGEAARFSGVLRGEHCLHALKLLISDCFEDVPSSFRGAWLGDPVILASESSPKAAAGRVAASSGAPARNLHDVAVAEFANISYGALAELCISGQLAMELVVKAKGNRRFLIDLGATLEQYEPAALRHAWEQLLGQPWRKEYNQAMADAPHWQPLPRIDNPEN